MWLDDLELSNPSLFSQIHIFSTFFYKKLSSGERYVLGITVIHLLFMVAQSAKFLWSSLQMGEVWYISKEISYRAY